jgi:hypothetical protein
MASQSAIASATPYRAGAIALRRTAQLLLWGLPPSGASFVSFRDILLPFFIRPAHTAKLMGNPKAAAGPFKLPRPRS